MAEPAPEPGLPTATGTPADGHPGPPERVPAGSACLYVYYHVDADALPAVVEAARLLQQRLAAEHPGLVCSLSRRPELRAGQATLMETYRLPGASEPDLGLALLLATEAAVLGLPAQRHLEWFIAL